MKVLFVRCGRALPRSRLTGDLHRPLHEIGVRQCERAAQWVSKLGKL